jgi:hypothetical protein
MLQSTVAKPMAARSTGVPSRPTIPAAKIVTEKRAAEPSQ